MCVVAVLLMPCASSARLHAHGRRLREGLPIISHIGSVTLGVTTIDELEARYGKGLPCLGGHSDGARLWAVSGTNLRIWADGFDYSDKGRVVYSFVIDSDNGPVDKSIPIVSPKVADLAFLSRILPNMRMKEVRKILLQSHVPFTTYKTSFHTTTNSRYTINRQGVIYTTWSVSLDFSNGRLTEIDLQCE